MFTTKFRHCGLVRDKICAEDWLTSEMIVIINCGSSKTPFFEEIVSGFDLECEIVKLDNINIGQVSNSNGVIVSGAPILLTEVDQQPYLDRLSFLKEISIPVLGVCFGHQILGMLHGAEVDRCKEDRSWQNIRQVTPSTLFEGIDVEAEFMEDHCECISLPEEFLHTATSEICEVEGMQHRSKPMFGVQFHPEVSGTNGVRLLENFCKGCMK